MRIRRKHLIFLGLALFANFLFTVLIIFHGDLMADVGEQAVLFFEFTVQIFSLIIMVWGISFAYKSTKKKGGAFYFWMIVILLAFVPVGYYLFL